MGNGAGITRTHSAVLGIQGAPTPPIEKLIETVSPQNVKQNTSIASSIMQSLRRKTTAHKDKSTNSARELDFPKADILAAQILMQIDTQLIVER